MTCMCALSCSCLVNYRKIINYGMSVNDNRVVQGQTLVIHCIHLSALACIPLVYDIHIH